MVWTPGCTAHGWSATCWQRSSTHLSSACTRYRMHTLPPPRPPFSLARLRHMPHHLFAEIVRSATACCHSLRATRTAHLVWRSQSGWHHSHHGMLQRLCAAAHTNHTPPDVARPFQTDHTMHTNHTTHTTHTTHTIHTHTLRTMRTALNKRRRPSRLEITSIWHLTSVLVGISRCTYGRCGRPPTLLATQPPRSPTALSAHVSLALTS